MPELFFVTPGPDRGSQTEVRRQWSQFVRSRAVSPSSAAGLPLSPRTLFFIGMRALRYSSREDVITSLACSREGALYCFVCKRAEVSLPKHPVLPGILQKKVFLASSNSYTHISCSHISLSDTQYI